jgi:hypothetical protein
MGMLLTVSGILIVISHKSDQIDLSSSLIEHQHLDYRRLTCGTIAMVFHSMGTILSHQGLQNQELTVFISMWLRLGAGGAIVFVYMVWKKEKM